MKECIKYVGLDVYKSTIAVAIAEVGSSEVRYFGEIPNTPQDINKVVKSSVARQTGLRFATKRAPVATRSIGNSVNCHRNAKNMALDTFFIMAYGAI